MLKSMLSKLFNSEWGAPVTTGAFFLTALPIPFFVTWLFEIVKEPLNLGSLAFLPWVLFALAGAVVLGGLYTYILASRESQGGTLGLDSDKLTTFGAFFSFSFFLKQIYDVCGQGFFRLNGFEFVLGILPFALGAFLNARIDKHEYQNKRFMRDVDQKLKSIIQRYLSSNNNGNRVSQRELKRVFESQNGAFLAETKYRDILCTYVQHFQDPAGQLVLLTNNPHNWEIRTLRANDL